MIASYEFKCVIQQLLSFNVDIQWELPYDVRHLPDDLDNIPDGNTLVEYWLVPHHSIKLKKITRLNDGKINELVLLRTICVAIGKDLKDFADCKCQ